MIVYSDALRFLEATVLSQWRHLVPLSGGIWFFSVEASGFRLVSRCVSTAQKMKVIIVIGPLGLLSSVMLMVNTVHI